LFALFFSAAAEQKKLSKLCKQLPFSVNGRAESVFIFALHFISAKSCLHIAEKFLNYCLKSIFPGLKMSRFTVLL
jgi:hypothetical protein